MMNRQTVTLQLVLLLVIISPQMILSQTRADFEKAKLAYEAGNLANNQGDFQKAIENYTNAINLYPYVPEFFYNRAVAYRSIRKYELAVTDLDKILELNPNLPLSLWMEFYFTRGTILQEKGDYDMALDNLDKAISLNPNNANYYLHRANTYTLLKKYDLAIADYNKSLEIMPFALTFYNRARLYDEKREFGQSIKDYTKAIELSPQFADAFSNRGLGYQMKGNLDLALRDFTTAISLNARDGVYYFNRANIYFQKREFLLSIVDYTKAIEIYPLWADALRRRASAYEKQGQKKLAQADLEKAKKVEKENFNPVNKTEIFKP